MAVAVAKRLQQLRRQSGLEDDSGAELLDQLGHGAKPRRVITVWPGGETLVHYACQHGWLNFIKSLIRQHYCNAFAVTHAKATPLHYACWYGHVDVVVYLLRDRLCDPHCCDNVNRTPLHHACRYGHYDIVHYLVTKYKCNPDCCDQHQRTPLHYICGPLAECSQGEAVKIVRFLVKANYDVNKQDEDGNTALHTACRRSEAYIVPRALLEEAMLNRNVNLDQNAKNNDGDTPLHLACKQKNSALVQLLVRDSYRRCKPNAKNGRGDTALHIACQLNEGDDISRCLLEERNTDPGVKNNDGDTPLHVACSNKKFKAVQLLVRDQRCNPNEKNNNGDTALHIACRLSYENVTRGDHRRRLIVFLLLEEAEVDVLAENDNGDIPLDLTSDPNLIREFIRRGANPQDVYKTHGKVLGKHSSKQPLQTPVKLFMVGKPSAGKSTLTKALQSEAFGLKRVTKRIVKVSGVDEKTAGIIPHEFESKTYGRVTLYDFAGQREFYGSHAALLQNAIQTSTPIFILVVDLNESNDNIKRDVFYWLSFLENQCTSTIIKPHFVVIGSHVDILKSRGEDPKQKASFIISLLATPQFASLEFIGFIAMDCQYADSTGMRKLHQALKTSCDSLRRNDNINFNAHCFLVYLLDKFRETTALTLATIQAQIKEDIRKAEGSTNDVMSFVPSDIELLNAICDQLNDRGHLLVLKNAIAIENSWVIINRTVLLAEVNGTIFAPKGFKQHIKLASSTGVVSLSNLAKHFPEHDFTMLVDFLSHLEFCHEISDSEILGLISQEEVHVSTASEISTVQGERYFFFPGLVTLEVPSTVWEPQPEFDYHCGWILQFSVLGQFFYPRFVQVLLLRLAFSFAFRKIPSTDLPVLQRKCAIWKNGIYWGDGHCIETLVEIAEQNTVVILMRCPEVKSECLQLRSLLIQKVLAVAREFCSKVSTVESFINPSDTIQYPLKPTSQLTLYNMPGIATAVAKGMPATVDDTGKPISLDSLLSFEPYADLGEPILRELLYSPCNTILSEELISKIALCISRKSQAVLNVFETIFLPLVEQASLDPAGTPLYRVRQVLMVWRGSCEGTYQCLREKLDQFSVFAGRKPLEIAGVSYESNTHPTDDSASVTPYVATAMECGPSLLEVSHYHIDNLAAVLDDLAGDWYRFSGLLGLSEGKRNQIQLNSAWKPHGAQVCLLDALHLWVNSDEAATYAKLNAVLQKHFPNKAFTLIKAVRAFVENVDL